MNDVFALFFIFFFLIGSMVWWLFRDACKAVKIALPLKLALFLGSIVFFATVYSMLYPYIKDDDEIIVPHKPERDVTGQTVVLQPQPLPPPETPLRAPTPRLDTAPEAPEVRKARGRMSKELGPEGGIISAEKLRLVIRDIEKQYGMKTVRTALGEVIGGRAGSLTFGAVQWLQKNYGQMNGRLKLYQQVLDSHLPGARLLDSNFDGKLDENDTVFVKETSGLVTAQPLGAALRDRVRIGAAIVEACRELARAKSGFAPIAVQRVNERYWRDSSKSGFFDLREGVRSSEAIHDALTHPGDYRIHSNTAIVLAYYNAVLKLIGPEHFDKRFDRIALGPRFLATDVLQRHIESDSNPSPAAGAAHLQVGDTGHVAGLPGASVINLGGGKLYCHPLGITSEKAIIAWLKKRIESYSDFKPYLTKKRGSLKSDVLRYENAPLE